MKAYFILIFLCVFVSACATTTYTHPTKSVADFEKDKYDCEQIANQYAANNNAQGNPFIISDQMKQCLEKKYGWRPTN